LIYQFWEGKKQNKSSLKQ